MSELMAVDRFQRLFRETADVEADKSDVRRVNDLINRNLHALMVADQGRAQLDNRDVIMAGDVPITAGLQECMRQFESLEEEVDMESVVDQLTQLPVLEMDYGDDLRARLPLMAGGARARVQGHAA